LKINYYNYIIKGKIFVKWDRNKVEARGVEIKEVIYKQISNQMDMVILKEDNIKKTTIQAIRQLKIMTLQNRIIRLMLVEIVINMLGEIKNENMQKKKKKKQLRMKTKQFIKVIKDISQAIKKIIVKPKSNMQN